MFLRGGTSRVNKKIQRLAEPSIRMMLVVLVIFAVVTLFIDEKLALVEGAVILLLIIYSLISSRRRRKQLTAYIESITYDVETAKNGTLLNFPLPMVAFKIENLRVVWSNESFFRVCGIKALPFEAVLTGYIPDFSVKWLTEGKKQAPALSMINGRYYQVFGSIVNTNGHSGGGADFMAIAYWVDVTDYEETRQKYLASRPIIAIIAWDNYEEVLKNAADRVKTELRGAVDDAVERWCAQVEGFVRRYDRDRYLFILQESGLDALVKQKFSLVDSAREIISPGGIHATVSIGVGKDGRTLDETFQFASLSVEMALSRGGDQTVIKNRFNFEFFGGRGAEIETRTKVKSRVVANALYELIGDASQVYIMGHRYADLDCVGGAAGVCCIARKRGVKAKIVIDLENNAASRIIEKLLKETEYKDAFISPQDAMLHADSRTVLVVVDTNRPEQTENEDLLFACNRVAIIDHHRRAASYIQNAAVTFHEPYASSVCELMSELLQELVEQSDILGVEAEAMLAGIVMDTKNFSIRTGGRTFDAAAFLRRSGADTVIVKQLLQNDLDSTISRYKILQRAKLYKGIAIAAPDEPQARIVAAQAADELLNIQGVRASVVVYVTQESKISVSARSIGDINVQVLLEKLGGGGNASAAATQLQCADIKAGVAIVVKAIDEYFAK
jgi:c-di-AMP phosphodiesterase-like protein